MARREGIFGNDRNDRIEKLWSPERGDAVRKTAVSCQKRRTR